MEQQEKQDKTIRKLKKQLKLYTKKVEDLEGNPVALNLNLLPHLKKNKQAGSNYVICVLF